MMTTKNVLNFFRSTQDMEGVATTTDPSELVDGELGIYNSKGEFQLVADINSAANGEAFYLYEGMPTGFAPVKSMKLEKGNITVAYKQVYAAADERKVTVDFSSYTPVVKDEIVLKLRGKSNLDVYQGREDNHPMQLIVKTGDTVTTIAEYFVTAINANKYFKNTITASNAAGVLTLDGTPFTNTDPLLVKYRLSDFDVYLEVNYDGMAGATVVVTTAGTPSVGSYQQVAALEEFVQGYDGPTNKVHWGPAEKGNKRVVSSATYDVYTLTGYLTSTEGIYAISGSAPSPIEVRIAVATGTTVTFLEPAILALAGKSAFKS
jgi:hypothetical protein